MPGDEHGTALLRVPYSVSNRLACLPCDQGACVAAGDVALIGFVALKDRGHDALALGVGEELIAITEETS